LKQIIDDLRIPGRHFVIVSDWPELPHDPVGCEIGNATDILRKNCTNFEADIRESFNGRQSELKAAFAKIGSEYPTVTTVFGDAPLCNQTRCFLKFDGVYMYRDLSHIRRNLPKSVEAAYGRALGFPILADGSSMTSTDTNQPKPSR
jgi:hypothetical protein